MKLNELTIKEAHEKLKSGEITCRDLTQACITRIKETESKINTLLAKNFDMALIQADEIDARIKAGEEVTPLMGIPNTIKDLLLTKGVITTAGSKFLENYNPLYSATVFDKLHDSGSILLGKNNLDAWAHGSSTENSAFGPSKNPYDLDRVPGGSSGGSASSVASDQCLFSIGTDTGGSIRQPASFCGVVGLKPTYGRVSRYGVIAMGSSLDCVGPITKTVEDAAIVLNAIAGHDEMDATTPQVKVPDYTKNLNDKLTPFKVGVPKQIYSNLPDESKKAFELGLEKIKKLGGTVEEIDMKYLEYGIATYYVIMPSEVSSNLGRYDGIRYGQRSKNVKDILDTYLKSRSQGFGDEAKRRIMIGTYVLSAGYYDAYYKKAMKVRTLIKNEFEDFYKNYDFIVMPSTLGGAFKLGEKNNDPLSMYLEDIFTVTANIAGVPAISIPNELIDGLPYGIQILGPHFSEEKILQLAHQFEKQNKIEKKLVV